MKAHTVGTLAYFDSLYGMIKGKVIKIDGDNITFKVTAPAIGYKVGECITSKSWKVVPRTSVHQRNYKMVIRNDYTWK